MISLYCTFTLNYKELSDKLRELEQKYNQQFSDVYEALQYLTEEKEQTVAQRERKRIGFKT
ncbi:MAG: hypothetical protein IPM95_11985 [Sphingobacteriales bacterium]|nr:hypothetical protein [Sphingobacteriales bacterium]